MSNREYLADGVYAENDGVYVALTTEGNRISVDHGVLAGLLRHVVRTGFADAGWMKDIIDEATPIRGQGS